MLKRYRKPLLLLCVVVFLIYHRNVYLPCDYPPFPGCYHEFFKPRNTPQFSLDYAYIHDARDLCNGLAGSPRDQSSLARTGPDVVILVLTMSKSVEERQAVRETYGSVARGEPWRSPDGEDQTQGTARVVFLMGQTKDVSYRDKEVDLLREESEKYGDVVQWDGVVEDYFNLTLKVLLGFRWVKHYCPHAQYVVKADDSTFIHLPRLFRHLARATEMTNEFVSPGGSPSERPYRIHGFLHVDSRPVSRTGKFAVSGRAYPFCLYPTYVDGPFYFMHVSLAMRILSVANYLPYINIEDAHVTGVSACVVKARHVGFGHSEYFPCQIGRRCDFTGHGHLMAAKDTTPETFKDIWKTFSDPDLCSTVNILYLRTFDILRQFVCSWWMNVY